MSRCTPVTGSVSRRRKTKTAIASYRDCRGWTAPRTEQVTGLARSVKTTKTSRFPVTGIPANQAPRYTLRAVSLRNPRCLSCPDLPRCPPPVFNSWRPTFLHWVWASPCGRSCTPMRLMLPQARPSTVTAWRRCCIRAPQWPQIPRRMTGPDSASSRPALARFPRGPAKRLISPITAVSRLWSASRG